MKQALKVVFSVLVVFFIARIGFLGVRAMWLYVHHEGWQYQNTIDRKISRYIKSQCIDVDPCRVNISDFTDFDWDVVCTVSEGAALDADPSIVPAPLPERYSFIDPKIVFILKGAIVRFEEVPMEIEYVPGGTVLFSGVSSCYDRKSEIVFDVAGVDNGVGDVYTLSPRLYCSSLK